LGALTLRGSKQQDPSLGCYRACMTLARDIDAVIPSIRLSHARLVTRAASRCTVFLVDRSNGRTYATALRPSVCRL